MKAKWFYGGILASALSLPGFGQLSIMIGTPPPPVRYDRRPSMPAPGYVWVDGYWAAQGRHYVWVPGGWQRPPYAGAYWTHPHYDHYDNGWQMHQGHWDHEDHHDENHGNGRGHDDGHEGGREHGH